MDHGDLLKNEVTSSDRDVITHADSCSRLIRPHRGTYQARRWAAFAKPDRGAAAPVPDAAVYSQMKSLLSIAVIDTPTSVICLGPM